MKLSPAESRLLEIAAQLLEKSRNGQVNWQTVGGEPANYYVHFGGETSFAVCFQAADSGNASASVFIKVKSSIAVRLRAEQDTENFATFKQLFDEAHRAATGWDKALAMIQEQIDSGGPLGDPPGDIPI